MVSDKLLGTQGADIDAAINSISGYNFAIQFSVNIGGSMEKWGFERRSVSNIEINPEIPKYLETAVPKILGWIDFVNPRRGINSDDIRIHRMIRSTLASTVTRGILTTAIGIRNPGK